MNTYIYTYTNQYKHIHIRVMSPMICECFAEAKSSSFNIDLFVMLREVLYVRINMHICTAPESSWRRVSDPVSTLLFNLYHYLEQNGAF